MQAKHGHNAQWRMTTSSDADDHAHNLSRWVQEYNQFSAGTFVGQITELWLPHTQLFLESTNQVLHQSCAAWSKALWFGIPVSRTDGARMGTTQIPEHSIAFKQGGTQFELFTPADFDIIGIVIDEDVFARYLQEVEHTDSSQITRKQGVMAVSPQAKVEVCGALIHMLKANQVVDGVHRHASMHAPPYHSFEDRILSYLAPLLYTGITPAASTPRHVNRHRIVERARDIVLGAPTESISIPELCRALHVSRRTLQYCFQDVVGMAPLNYLRILKLNQVRRDLRTGSTQRNPVTQAALSWGFYHLGQFSADYRKLFGEVPSHTVTQASTP
ncbi:helix-turn-helix domain-containing protein [Alcaligenaceae bacterium CGII-47]|nr:helix-turn-helix domain-containing protein [Alcaligenaceae bacterium CGII-47]